MAAKRKASRRDFLTGRATIGAIENLRPEAESTSPDGSSIKHYAEAATYIVRRVDCDKA